MSGYFNDDDIDMDENELARLNAFMEYMAAKQEEYFSVPRVRVINPQRYRQFQYALFKIIEITKRTNPNAKIDYTLNKESNIGIASITIETDELATEDILKFINSVKFATNFEVYPLLNGNIRMAMTFYNMWNEIKTEEST